MPRVARIAPGGMLYHVLNRGVGRMPLFRKAADYEAFERIIEKTLLTRPMRIVAYCLMPNHWHLLLWPKNDGDLAAFMQKLTVTHVRNWQINRDRVGYGHVYQGRYKSFPVQSDEHFYRVACYVERNALRAKLVRLAEDWRFGSLWRRTHGTEEQQAMLSRWPLPLSNAWLAHVNRAQSEAELAAIRRSMERGAPYGGDRWTKATVKRLGLESTLRPRGRPRKQDN